MATALRVLQIEDSEDDATLVLRELRRGGYDPVHKRVDTKEAFLDALHRTPWDVILSDFAMPRFNGLDAFDVLEQSGLDIPFIFVSGHIGQERAVAAMRRGAKDYVLKDNLIRLVPAVERELRDAEDRRKRQAIADALRESDEKLRAHERLLQTVFDTLPVHLVVKDTDTRYQMVNKAWCERYGLTPDQVIGKTTVEVPGRPEADRMHTLEQDRKTLAGDSSLIQFEGSDRTASGEIRHFQSSKAPLRDESGKVTGLVGATVDLTELKRAEETLRQNILELESANEELQALQLSLEAEIAERTSAEQRFHQLVELAPNAMVTVNAEGRIVLVNAQVLDWFGYGRADLIGQPVEMLIPERYRVRHPALVSGFFRAPAPRTIGAVRDLYGLRKDGSEFPIDISLSPIETAEGLQVIASVVDMTDILRAQAEVHASQQLLQTVFDTIPLMLMVKNSESRILMVNKAWSDAYGIAPKEAVNRHTLDLPNVPEAEKRRSLDDDRQIFTERKTFVAAERLFTIKGGRQIPVLSYKSPLYDDTGTVTGLVGAFVDISDRVRAEEELHTSQRLLQTVFDTLPVTLAVKDLDSRYRMVNQAWSKQYGVAPEKIVGMHTLDIPNRPEQEKLASLEQDRKVLAGNGSPVVSERWDTIGSGQRRFYHGIKAALPDDQGHATGLIAVTVDYTEQKRAEEALQERERQLNSMYDTVGDTIYQLAVEKDGRYRFVSVNQAFRSATGLSNDQVVGKRVDEVVPEPSLTMVLGKYEEAIRDKKIVRWEETSDYPRGRLTGDVSVAAVFDNTGTCTHLVGAVHDITESKRQAEMLRQAQKMEAIGQLTGGVAHDFNNILAVIMSFGEMVLDRLEEGNPLHADMKVILDAADRAAALTRQLLAFSRRQVLRMEPVNLNEIVTGMDKMLRRVIRENVALQLHPSPDLALVKADRSQIEQIIMNLAVNARDAMPESGILTVETANRVLGEEDAREHGAVTVGPHAMLVVTDTGTGMDEATQARIFEPFFTTKPLGTGTGLGLATVYGIVSQMGGTIWVYSEHGKGTTFKILLPALPGQKIAAPAAASETPIEAAGSETILLVEDEDSVREAARRILSNNGYTVHVARNGMEAVEALQTKIGEIDCILSDVVMPGMSTKDLLEAVRKISDVPIVFMSGYTDVSIINQGILERGIPFLHKPFTKRSLLEKVREALPAKATGAH